MFCKNLMTLFSGSRCRPGYEPSSASFNGCKDSLRGAGNGNQHGLRLWLEVGQSDSIHFHLYVLILIPFIAEPVQIEPAWLTLGQIILTFYTITK